MRARHAIYLLAIVSAVAAFGCSENAKPIRSECIVRADVLPEADGAIDDAKLLALLPAASQARVPLAGYSVQGSVLYLQYSSLCEDRLKLSSALLSRVGFGTARPLSAERITPGTDTIELTGPSWRD